MKTARFWIWHVEGFVRLSLRDGHKIEFVSGGAHEEGYSCTVECYSREGDVINYQCSSWGRDCDGGYGDNREFHCHVSQLTADDDGGYDGHAPARPAWVKGEACQYDQHAEAAGY